MTDLIISLCIPCMDRTYNLKETMPYIIKAANASPPVEIAVVNYGSRDDLRDYIERLKEEDWLEGSNFFTYREFHAPYYHVAHAHNLSVLASKGQCVVVSGVDIIPRIDFFKFIRDSLEEDKDIVWMQSSRLKGVIACRREEYIASGGYDERFEFYSPGDRDIALRLKRRGGKFKGFPWELLHQIATPKVYKFRNFRPGITRKMMKGNMRAIYKENETKHVLVVNEGVKWGQWQPPAKYPIDKEMI